MLLALSLPKADRTKEIVSYKTLRVILYTRAKLYNTSLFLGIITCLLLFSSTSRANDFSPEWSIKGFGSLSIVGTDTNKIGFYRDRSQAQNIKDNWGVTPDSRLGIQLDANFNAALQMTVQWVARDHAGNFFEQNLEWAFLRWRPQNDLDIRVGRLGTDVFLSSDYRNVSYAYPWMRPPHEFYGTIPIYHYDGFDIGKRYTINNGYLTLKMFAGYSTNQLISNPGNELFDFNAPVAGGNLTYEHSHWLTKLSYVFVHPITDTPGFDEASTLLNNPLVNLGLPGISELTPYLTTKHIDMHFISIGGAYDDGVWLAQAEAAYLHSDSPLFPSQTSAYLSFGRRFSSVTLYTLFGIAHSFEYNIDVPEPVIPNPELQEIHDSINGFLNQNGIDEKSISLGVRWDVYSNIALKAQWSHFWLGQNGTQLWQEFDTEPTPDKVNVWSFGFDFIF